MASFAIGFVYQATAQPSDPSLPDNPDPASSVSVRSDRPTDTRDATWRSFVPDFFHDQKGIWIAYPGHLARGHYWIPTLAVAGVTAGLIVADPHIMPYFRSHQGNLDDTNDVFDPNISTAMIIAVPASIMASGYIRHDEYAVSTALLSGEAYADSIIPNLAIKAITRRERPADIPYPQPFTNTFFNPNKSALKGSSFPSGHATGAFSVAAVVATRYRNHKWVPWAVYGLATAVSVSRVTTLAHFPSDVFLGGATGYIIARYQTLQPR
ncbi:MAG TPA: phosphatase PAP2 family protein [Terracidiphilus sp.]|nr:phosphatase PAP2 family protein [Terracidiphilus sp.]